MVAPAVPRLLFEECNCSRESLIERLQASACLAQTGSSMVNENWRVSQRQLGLSAGHYISISAGITWAKEKEFTLKDTFLKRWADGHSYEWEFRMLEGYFGVAISICTFNAIRVRLVDLLKTDSMKNCLRSSWHDSDCRSAYFQALKDTDPRALRNLWHQRPEWREELQDALLLCLNLLCEATGYDERLNQLTAFWSPSSKREENVSLTQTHYTVKLRAS